MNETIDNFAFQPPAGSSCCGAAMLARPAFPARFATALRMRDDWKHTTSGRATGHAGSM